MLAYGASPISDGKDDESAAGEKPSEHSKCQSRALIEEALEHDTAEQPNEAADDKSRQRNSPSVPHEAALLWCRLLHQ